jgi:hypothetical protein
MAGTWCHDLDHGSGAAVLASPAPLLEPAQNHDPAALRQGLRGMLGLVLPHDHGEERRLLLPPTRDGYPEHGPGDAAVGVTQLGLVGEVAGEVVVTELDAVEAVGGGSYPRGAPCRAGPVRSWR